MKTLDQLIAENTELTANLGRITNELATTNGLLVTANATIAELNTKLTTATTATADLQTKFDAQSTELTGLKAKDMDVETRAAAKVKALGIAGGETKPESKTEPNLTITEQCLKANGIEFKPGEKHILLA